MILNRFLLWPAKNMRLYIYYKPLLFDRPQIQSFKNLPNMSAKSKDDTSDAWKLLKPKVETDISSLIVSTNMADSKIFKEKKTAKSCGSTTGGGSTKPPAKSSKRTDFIQRATHSGKCRWGFVPEEFFLFFYPLTGVSGAYLFVLGIANFMLSKEYYILEHEYYSGLSIFLMLWYTVKYHGKSIGAYFDKQVDAVLDSYNKQRENELKMNQDNIDSCKDLQLRAQAQKLLMDGKKENIAMQLEAAYRQRTMLLYRRVKGRLDYHVLRHRAEMRIQKKWMLEWILEQVSKSITPEFEKKALTAAINDLASAADRVKKT